MSLIDTEIAALHLERKRKQYPQDLPFIPPLATARYHDRRFYDLEIEHVFKKTWLTVGHVSELQKSGSYKLFERFGQSIIVSRGLDDTIRAFRNACRHRGAALVTEPAGVARRFMCPYHAWGYAADGKLISVPEAQNFACLKKSELHLQTVRCEIWRGFVFINLGDGPGSLADFMAPLAAEVEDFPFEAMSIKGMVTVNLACNWKTAFDNFVESYHINTVHQKTIAPYMNPNSFMIKHLPNGHARHMLLKRGDSGSMFRTKSVLDVAERYKTATVALSRFPNAMVGLDPAGFNWQSFWPTGPETMTIVNQYIGQDQATPDADREHWANLMANNDAVLAEDMQLFPSIQRAMREGDIKHLILNTQEQYIQWYHENLDRAIGVENIPEDLRVDPVLTRAGC